MYKPDLSETCCPQYTIRADAVEYQPNKSHKKVVKRFARFLRREWTPPKWKKLEKLDAEEPASDNEQVSETRNGTFVMMHKLNDTMKKLDANQLEVSPRQKRKLSHGSTAHRDKKAKADTRNWLGVIQETESSQEGYAFRVEIKRAAYEEDTHELYTRYQTTIHDDDVADCTRSRYSTFLVTSPLIPEESDDDEFPGYGSFHYKYFLDDKLVAVEVVDILPKCVSSVYFMYDPEYSFLSLGTYSALRSIAHIQELHQIQPAIRYYYLGYYIHTCVKMRYKGQYVPSELLDPMDYSWHPIQTCLAQLDKQPYVVFSGSQSVSKDELSELPHLRFLNDGRLVPWSVVRMYAPISDLKEYVSLVGRSLARKMVVVLE